MTFLMITRQKAFELLNKHMTNRNLIRHSLAAEAAMRSLAAHFGENIEKWGIVGLLHDGDYEVVGKDLTRHAKQMVEWLWGEGETDEELLRAILSHVYSHTGENEPQSKLEWSIYCADELTGLIVAVALVTPNKKLKDVTTDSVISKFKIKSFASGANRDHIKTCEEKLGIKLEEFIGVVLAGMKRISNDLGL